MHILNNSTMTFPALHDHPSYAYDPLRPAQWSEHDPANEFEDPYDACKDSPLVDTLVEGGVVVLIALLINITFWGIIRFGVPENPLYLSEVA